MRLRLFNKFLPKLFAQIAASVTPFVRKKKPTNGMKPIQAEQFAESLTVFTAAYIMLMRNRIPTHDSPEEEWQAFLRGAMKAFVSKQTKLKDYTFHNVAIELFKPLPGIDFPNANGRMYPNLNRKSFPNGVGGGLTIGIAAGAGGHGSGGSISISGGNGSNSPTFLRSDGAVVGPQAPSNPQLGQVWYDNTDINAPTIKVYDGNKWVPCAQWGKV